MGDRDGATAWYRSAVELLGAVMELQDHCHTWPPCALDAANDESAKPAKAKRNKKSSRHDTTLVNEPVRKWQLMLSEVQRLLEKIGSQPSLSPDGRVIIGGSGLLGAADDAFRDAEPQLQDAQLDAAVGRFEVDGYGSHRYAWPVVAKVAAEVQRWATNVADHWLNNPPDHPRSLARRLALREAVDACPLSPQIIAKLGARFDLERAWLKRLPAEGDKNAGENQDSREPGRPPKERTDKELGELQSFVDLRNEWEMGKAKGDKKCFTSGTDPRSFEAFFHWLRRTNKVNETQVNQWEARGGENVRRHAKRLLPHLFKPKPTSTPRITPSISDGKPRKKKSKFSMR